VDSHSQVSWAPQAQYYIGDVYFMSRDFVAAEKAYALVKKNYPKSYYAARAQYSIARIYEEQANYLRAKTEYETFVKDYPEDGFVRKAKNKLDILGLFRDNK
jgi:TolA-binding protein